MATILKQVDDEGRILEVASSYEGVIRIWVGMEEDFQSWTCVDLNKEDVRELIKHLQKRLR